ncbi:TetR/AcrR family transcriptional regulator C-terminal domain-containing protein [Kribbella italica]|uniref:AcrR family transcriptional regulator n=1 Tax=Kribbella italica TaxID=1540520 RepID=A0A7W9JF57_9ACTN|nr:AcrR family transcriptional regulator [Kribbella italica]
MTRPEPSYLRIAAELEKRIRSGALRPGDRVPSVRQIALQWGVAIATATRVITALREAGLVDTRVGSGTVVTAQPALSGPVTPQRTGPSPMVRPRRASGRRARGAEVLSRDRLLRAAVTIADGEGLEAVSMRRVAGALRVGPMSLYRYVAHKNDLLAQMADHVFGEDVLPDPGSEHWRSRLELIARTQWALCRRHLWLPRVVSFTRPSLAPNMMAHTEWTLRALDGLGLPIEIRMREAMTLHALVITAALSLAEEHEAEHETGMTLAHWMVTQRARTDELFASGRFPLLAELHEIMVPDLDAQFDYGLDRHLDGLVAYIEAQRDG